MFVICNVCDLQVPCKCEKLPIYAHHKKLRSEVSKPNCREYFVICNVFSNFRFTRRDDDEEDAQEVKCGDYGSLDEDLHDGKVFFYSWGGSNIGLRSVALQRGTSSNTVSRMKCIQILT